MKNKVLVTGRWVYAIEFIVYLIDKPPNIEMVNVESK